MRTSAPFGAKNFGLFEIFSVSARTSGEGNVQISYDGFLSNF